MEGFSREDILTVIKESEKSDIGKKDLNSRALENKIVGELFFEPSTRTKLSFESAIKQLEGRVIGFSEAENSSIAKGETFEDTIRVIENYCDLIILRHPEKGKAEKTSEISSVPIINAGDGSNEHPTQALLDLYSIKRFQNKIDGLKVGLVGDLKYGRTIHSLVLGLRNFDVDLRLISPEELGLPERYKSKIDGKLSYQETRDFNIEDLDVIYMTRIQKERFTSPHEYNKFKGVYRLEKGDAEKMKDETCIMHPLPRIDEISKDLDSSKHAKYFEQARNAVPVRKAILKIILGDQNE